MSDAGRCARCGTLAGQAASLEGLCPACLLAAALARPPLTILTRLGAGPSSVAYLAEHPDDPGRLAVLKKMTPAPHVSDIASRVEELRRHAATLVHPHIARVLELGIDEDGCPYSLTEFWPGIPIARFREHARERPDEARIDGLREQSEGALAFAHAHGVVHGGISASNLLVARTASGPALKIVDFGHAALVGRRTGPASAADDWRALRGLL